MRIALCIIAAVLFLDAVRLLAIGSTIVIAMIVFSLFWHPSFASIGWSLATIFCFCIFEWVKFGSTLMWIYHQLISVLSAGTTVITFGWIRNLRPPRKRFGLMSVVFLVLTLICGYQAARYSILGVDYVEVDREIDEAKLDREISGKTHIAYGLKTRWVRGGARTYKSDGDYDTTYDFPSGVHKVEYIGKGPFGLFEVREGGVTPKTSKKRLVAPQDVLLDEPMIKVVFLGKAPGRKIRGPRFVIEAPFLPGSGDSYQIVLTADAFGSKPGLRSVIDLYGKDGTLIEEQPGWMRWDYQRSWYNNEIGFHRIQAQVFPHDMNSWKVSPSKMEELGSSMDKIHSGGLPKPKLLSMILEYDRSFFTETGKYVLVIDLKPEILKRTTARRIIGFEATGTVRNLNYIRFQGSGYLAWGHSSAISCNIPINFAQGMTLVVEGDSSGRSPKYPGFGELKVKLDS